MATDELREIIPEIKRQTVEYAPQYRARADILFILDSSGSISPADYQKELDFVIYLINNFNIGPDYEHFSVMVFSNDPQILFNFTLTTHDQTTKKIKAAPHIGGGTNTAAALELARTQVFTSRCGSRGEKKIAVIITGSCSENIHGTARAAEQLRESGVLMLAVGVGNINPVELAHIATLPEDVYTVDNYSVLQTIQDQLSEKICRLDKARRSTVRRPPLPPLLPAGLKLSTANPARANPARANPAPANPAPAGVMASVAWFAKKVMWPLSD